MTCGARASRGAPPAKAAGGQFFFNIRSASGRMRRDTLLSPGRLALPTFSPPPLTISPGARPIIS
eukprot:scaffold2738_cov90-Isochrysis_galbana.AAC.4